jgi:hypothetical protein
MKSGNGFRLLVAVLVAQMLAGVAHASSLTGMLRMAGQNVGVPGATVVVYAARSRKGHDTVCPGCYEDVGKHVTTDAGGNFSIGGLDNQLVFDFVVLAEGLTPRWYSEVDPLQIDGPIEILTGPLPAANRAGTVLGRVVDAGAQPVPHALIELVGLDFGGDHPTIGNFPDGLAISNANGQFELRSDVARALGGALPKSLIVEVRAPRLAPALHKVPVGSTRQDLRVTDGATVQGRVLAQGKPAAKVDLVLLTSAQNADERYAPITISTDKEGRFSFSHVPAGREWSVDANSDSGLGSVTARSLTTPADGQSVDLGDVEVQKGSSLTGHVELSDDKILPPGVRVTIKNNAGGIRNAVLDWEHKFEFKGLSGSWQLVPPEVPGYRLRGSAPELSLQRNVKGLTITLEPQP